MSRNEKRLMIMAAGTGGHIFPGLAIAKTMRERGWTFDPAPGVVPDPDGAATLFDDAGPFGTAMVTAIANPAAQIDFGSPDPRPMPGV